VIDPNLDFRDYVNTDFIVNSLVKAHKKTGKLVALVFCCAACFEAATGIKGLTSVEDWTLRLFRATWQERDARVRARTLLDPVGAVEVPDLNPHTISLQWAISAVMFSVFLCSTSRDQDKITVEMKRILSTVRSWREYIWITYIGRKTYSMQAVSTLLLGPNRLKFDPKYLIDEAALSDVVEEITFGDAILHGEAKREFVRRVVGLRQILLQLPDIFIQGSAQDVQRAIRVFKQENNKTLLLAENEIKVFHMTHPDQFLTMGSSNRLFHFYKSLYGNNVFHAWQCCLDFPQHVYDRNIHRVVGPTCYQFLKLAFRQVSFPACWYSLAGQKLGVSLLEYSRHHEHLQGLAWQSPVLSFCDAEHWSCDTIKVLKGISNLDLLTRVLEFQGKDVLPESIIPIPPSGKFRCRKYSSDLIEAGAENTLFKGNLLHVKRETSKRALATITPTNVSDTLADHDPTHKRQQQLSLSSECLSQPLRVVTVCHDREKAQGHNGAY